jgi:hypothetical protein
MNFSPSVILALVLPTGAAFADPVPANLRSGLSDSVETFEAAIAQGDFAATFDFMPPKVLDLLAAQAGMSVDEVLIATKTDIEVAMATISIDEFGMDVAAADWQVTPDGQLGFALIPTVTLLSVPDMGQLKGKSETVAFPAEDGSWYLIRIDDASQVSLLQAAYPAFVGVDFPVGSMELVE